ncbi:substrate-binding periplasmic protein [Pseudoalteromonas sp. T1lg48]|uniref:substrate-binding periplasmic protein n=1 Tax=Pseudoalteromonas sp. T1lg48 TaxID=2077100 RepID=UPI000CF738B6|nr:transporter substrate-binding domain-containing protein [Pseudoalteromonas sp. T1lg48]
MTGTLTPIVGGNQERVTRVLRALFLWLVLLGTATCYAHELKGAYPDHFPPFSIAAEPMQGIIPDMLRALNRTSDHAYVAAPYARQSIKLLAEGQLDFLFDSQNWCKDEDNYYWSQPIAYIHDVLILREDADHPFSSLEELVAFSQAKERPLVVAGRYEYVYPSLDPLFAQAQLTRKNFYSDLNMIKALQDAEHGGVEAVVMAERVFDYLAAKNPHIAKNLVKSSFKVHSTPYQFRFPRTDSGKINMMYTNRLLSQLQTSGSLEDIIDKYSGAEDPDKKP